ncbi:hypothetical protein [Pseudarthrobacter sp. NamE5]|uniref:hypothetical protein n=1 Tax=Pseudarthrobacter sp. NamE5 TaxID=2576839 RepID=UPI00110B7C59|nr:hypothetical protein [Pseudarthrobacter sp. NamE5]TLM88268.1 hypothetical protein FDW84_01795 [Pseudarthrobacter sp. NamE5]
MELALIIALTAATGLVFRRSIARLQAKSFMIRQIAVIRRVLPDTLPTERHMTLVFEQIGLAVWCIMALGSVIIALDSAFA